MDTKVKICGIKDVETAKIAYEAGADYLGFIFVQDSGRYVTADVVNKIRQSLNKKIPFVGVFKDQPVRHVNAIVKNCGLEFVQLHGKENPDYCVKIQTKVIKAVPADLAIIARYSVDYFLIDREKQGEGVMVDMNKAARIVEKYPLFLAGGLTPKNVANVVKSVKPFAVDVSGGVEVHGRKDKEKIRNFIRFVKGELL